MRKVLLGGAFGAAVALSLFALLGKRPVSERTTTEASVGTPIPDARVDANAARAGTKPNPPTRPERGPQPANPDAVAAARYLGLDLEGDASLAAHLPRLLERHAAGDGKATLQAVDLLQSCRGFVTSRRPLGVDPMRDALVAQCKEIREVDMDPADLKARLIDEAAARGDAQAILLQKDFPPLKAAYDRLSPEGVRWARTVRTRLEALAASGNLDALVVLGHVAMGETTGRRDYAAARAFYLDFLQRSPMNHPRRREAELRLEVIGNG